MSLFWLVYKRDGVLEVVLKPANDLLFAQLYCLIDGQEGEFVEGHRLDKKTQKRVPKAMIGKPLSQKQAVALLKKLGRA